MKNLLIISFDIPKYKDNTISYAIASILSYLKNDKEFKKKFDVFHLSVNMNNYVNNDEWLENKISSYDLRQINYIAISAYVWNDFMINQFMRLLKGKMGYKGKIILGGYQITYSNNVKEEYPESDLFISGDAEIALLNILKGQTNKYDNNKCSIIYPSPYLTKDLKIIQNQQMVRMETQRGCPFACSFCAHRDIINNKVTKHNIDKVKNELILFKEKEVKKINIIDPVFNYGNSYLNILEEMIDINLNAEISIQTRFEGIKGIKGQKFLDLCEQLNINLEFGLQTAITSESEIINRKNDMKKVTEVIDKLNKRKIRYEISLIYGLPTQTLKSFSKSIDFVNNCGCSNVTAFPLMLLKGTRLYYERKKYNLIEKKKGRFNIPVVVKSDSFSEYQWENMKMKADELMANSRV